MGVPATLVESPKIVVVWVLLFDGMVDDWEVLLQVVDFVETVDVVAVDFAVVGFFWVVDGFKVRVVAMVRFVIPAGILGDDDGGSFLF